MEDSEAWHNISIIDEIKCFADHANAAAIGQHICSPLTFNNAKDLDAVSVEKICRRILDAKVLGVVGMDSLGRLYTDTNDPALKPMFLVEMCAPSVYLDKEAGQFVIVTDGSDHYLARRLLSDYVCIENRNYVDFSDYYLGDTLQRAIEKYTSKI